MDKIPVAAGLDALRTVRSDFGHGLEATGSLSGKLSYAEIPPETPVAEQPAHGKRTSRTRGVSPRPTAPGPLTGSLTVDGFRLSGDGLSTPIQASRLVLEPVAGPGPAQSAAHPSTPNQPVALEANLAIPAGGLAPLTVTARLALSGYQLTVHGQASVVRARELAHVAGMADASALDGLAGDPISIDLDAAGPWMPAQAVPFAALPHEAADAGAAEVANGARLAVDVSGPPPADDLSATVTVRNADWKADYLANHLEITQAALHLDNGEQRWDPIVFSYGPVKGTATLHLAARCASGQSCPAAPPVSFNVHFTDLDAGTLQAAFLGAHQQGTLLSSLLARLKPADASSAAAWPPLEGTVKADLFTVGPVTLTSASANIHILPTGADITALEADLFGGRLHGGGTLRTATDEGKPAYTLEGQFEKLNPARVGPLLGLKWSGGTLDANGKINLAGFTDKDLAASAKGSLHFEWSHGGVSAAEDATSVTPAIPAALARFDRWTADADIADGSATLKNNEVQQGTRRQAVEGTLTLGDPAKASFTAPNE
jgi:hypothetical protein